MTYFLAMVLFLCAFVVMTLNVVRFFVISVYGQPFQAKRYAIQGAAAGGFLIGASELALAPVPEAIDNIGWLVLPIYRFLHANGTLMFVAGFMLAATMLIVWVILTLRSQQRAR